MVGESQSLVVRYMSSRKKMLYSLVAVIIVLGLLELFVRLIEIWAPPLRVDYGLGFDADSRLFQVNPNDPAMLEVVPDKLSNFLPQEFTVIKKPHTFRIAVLGGSSVYQLQNELAELSSRLSGQFPARCERIEIINAGGRAYGSHRELPILLELFELDLDMVLIYSGHNEFEEVEQLELANLQSLGLHRGLARSALVRFLRDRIAYVQISKLQAEHNRRVLASDSRPFGANYVRASRHRWTREEVDDRMDRFRHNLQTMIEQCRARNIPVVLGTVPSNLVKPAIAEDTTADVRDKYQRAIANYTRGNFSEAEQIIREILRNALGRHQSSDQENEIIRSLAVEHQVPLADVEKAVIEREPHGVPGMSFFSDHCHLNADGRKIWIESFEPVVISLINQGKPAAQ